MATPHERAVALALQANDELGELFDALGSENEPVGIYGVYALYLARLRELWDVPARALPVMVQMEGQLSRELISGLTGAARLGALIAASFVGTYQLPSNSALDIGTEVIRRNAVQAGVDALMAAFRAQLEAARGALLMGIFDRDTVLGFDDRPGLLAPGPVIRESTRWIAATASAVQAQVIDTALGTQRGEWGLQAVAAIDERTTECCLKVHGQVVPIDGVFTLTGEPRYADEMKQPPFHMWCRSSLALVRLADATDAMTERMIDAAFDEFKARKERSEARVRVPSSATSRRG